MYQSVGCRRPWEHARHVGRWGLWLALLVVWGLTLADPACVAAAETPDRGGTMTWAVHESMPHFDIHGDGSYILAQPVGPL